jgi:hypothetical protein
MVKKKSGGPAPSICGGLGALPLGNWGQAREVPASTRGSLEVAGVGRPPQQPGLGPDLVRPGLGQPTLRTSAELASSTHWGGGFQV